MSVRATNFAAACVAENINPESYDPGSEVVATHIEQLRADAQKPGINGMALHHDIGDLAAFIAEVMEAANDSVVERLPGRITKGVIIYSGIEAYVDCDQRLPTRQILIASIRVRRLAIGSIASRLI